MWKSTILKLGYKSTGYLNALGLGNLKLVRRLKQMVKHVLTRSNTLLIRVHGVPMYIYSDTATTRDYLARPFEPHTTALLQRALRPGATFLDIGAQFGYFTLIAARGVGPHGRVYAFEPVPRNFRLLQRNVSLSGFANIVPVQRAVGDRQTVVNMFVYGDSDSHSMYRHPQAHVKETIGVEGIAIDEFLGGQTVDVIKLDIEGHEPYALEGMKQTIAKSDVVVLFAELAPAYLRRGGVEPRDYLAKLQSLGFSPQLIDEESRTLREITPELLSSAERNPSWSANLYCTKQPLEVTA